MVIVVGLIQETAKAAPWMALSALGPATGRTGDTALRQHTLPIRSQGMRCLLLLIRVVCCCRSYLDLELLVQIRQRYSHSLVSISLSKQDRDRFTYSSRAGPDLDTITFGKGSRAGTAVNLLESPGRFFGLNPCPQTKSSQDTYCLSICLAAASNCPQKNFQRTFLVKGNFAVKLSADCLLSYNACLRDPGSGLD